MLLPFLGLRLSHVALDGADEALFDELYALYATSHAIDREAFEAKTRRKFTHLAILRDRTGCLVGFVGARARRVTLADGRSVSTVMVGQAMVAPAHRRGPVAVLGPLLLVGRQWLAGAGERVYMWHDCITVRTFLLVARGTDRYYPHPRHATPDDVQAVLDAVGTETYGPAYCAETHVVRKGTRLVCEGDIPEHRLQDEVTAFYADRNPGYVRGDGLLQVVPVDLSVLVDTVRTLLRRTRRAATVVGSRARSAA